MSSSFEQDEVAQKFQDTTPPPRRPGVVPVATYHNPFAGTPFRAPPPYLRHLYEITDKDYGVEQGGWTYTIPIPYRDNRYLLLSRRSFDDEHLKKHPSIDIRWGAPTYFRENAGPAISADFPGVKLFYRRGLDDKALMASFIASIVRIGPAVYDLWWDPELESGHLITEEIEEGSLASRELRRARAKLKRDESFSVEAAKMTNLYRKAKFVYCMQHFEPNDNNILWNRGNYLFVDWPGVEFCPRRGDYVRKTKEDPIHVPIEYDPLRGRYGTETEPRHILVEPAEEVFLGDGVEEVKEPPKYGSFLFEELNKEKQQNPQAVNRRLVMMSPRQEMTMWLRSVGYSDAAIERIIEQRVYKAITHEPPSRRKTVGARGKKQAPHTEKY